MSSLHQGGISTCLAYHNIQSDWCKGKGSGSLGIDVGGVAGHLPPQCQLGMLFPTQEFLEVGLQWWETLQIFISFGQDGPSLSPWPQPIGLFKWHLLSPPHWWGQLVGLIYSSVAFWSLFYQHGCSPFSSSHPMLLPGGTRGLGLPLNSALWWEVAWGPTALASDSL